jgi:PAS domain S-box-containing protein
MNKHRENAPTVLIVNDDPQQLALFTDLLEPDGYKIFIARDAQRALEITALVRTDVIICDVVMPQMDGMELCRRLKQDSRTASTPVLLVSAVRKEDAALREGFAAGADDYIEIPFRHEQFLVKVARLSERHRVERRYRDMVEHAADIIYTRDMSGTITSINDAGARFFGRPALELIGQRINVLFGAKDLEDNVAEMQKAILGEPVRFVHCPMNALGERRYLEEIDTLEIDSEGQPLCVRGVVRDITEQQVAEKALRESEHRYRELFENANDIIYTHDLNGNFTSLNKSGECITGYSREEALGMNINDLLAPESVAAARQMLASKRLNEAPTVYEVQIFSKSGRRLALEVSTRLIYSNDRAVGVQGIARDISERRNAEEALAQQVERTALINRISQAVRRTLDVPDVFETAVRELGAHLKVDRCSLFMKDERAGRVINVAEYHVAKVHPSGRDFDLPQVQGLNAAIEKHGAIWFDDVANDERIREFYQTVLQPYEVKSIMYVGVSVGNELLGAFALSSATDIRPWTAGDIEVAKAVAEQTAIAIRQARLFQIVERGKKEWESTFDAMSDGIFIFDRGGRLIRVNHAGAAMDSAPPQSLLGKQCCDILRTSTDGDACIVEQALRQSKRINVEIVPQNLNRPLLVTVEPILEAHGQIAGAVCTARDLSELRKVEAVARERQSLLQNILESARECIYALDREGNYKWCNQAMLELTGYQSKEIIGHHFLEHTYEEDREMRQQHFAAVLNGEPRSFESRYFARNGDLRYAAVNCAPIVVDGQTTGVLGIAHDITEQKHEHERAARADKLRALGQLASGVAHDFNNSLAAILGRAQLILRRVSDEDLIRSLGIIVTAAEDAAATVRRIQTFARKSVSSELEILDLGELLRDAMEITRTRWQNEARAAGINIEVTLNAEPGLLIRGSASELREVFVNLIVNAVDAMPLGGKLNIHGRRQAERLKLSFADTGTGMKQEVRDRIFEPFYTTKGAHGTGLGLAVSYGIIERHAGIITVESKVATGTTFHLELPLSARDDTLAVKPSVDVSAASLSVLIVDDEEFVRETLAEMLADLDHSVTIASGGREALEKLKNADFDLVFTDLAMPDMDGWETARAIRQRRPNLPVVLVTGYGSTTKPPAGEFDLVAEIIGKPFDFAQVTGAIARVCCNEVLTV